MIKKVKIGLFLFFLLSSKFAFAWESVNCERIKQLSYNSDHFFNVECQTNFITGVKGEYIQLISNNYTNESLYITDEYLIDHNSIWANDFSYQYLKRDFVEKRLYNWGFANKIEFINTNSQKVQFSNHKFDFVDFKTDLGVGFIATGQRDNHSWDFMYFNEDLGKKIDINLATEILKPMKIKGLF